MNERIYFETSGVNYLFDNVFDSPDFSSIETKKLQLSKGRKWQISNVTLWEMFLTKDEKRRIDLFDFSRCLFFDNLISSPEEIIINYIKNGCPRNEKQYELKSNALFSREWTQACKDRDFFFQPDRDQLIKYTDHLRFLGEYFVKRNKGFVLQKFNTINEISNRIDGALFKFVFDELIKQCNVEIDDEVKNYITISIQVVLIILCFGIGFDIQIIEDFWNKDRQTQPLERIEIAVKKFPAIFFRGPLSNITKMILLQANNKTGRGLYFDSLHSIYTTYSDLYITNDDHFLKFKSDNENDPNMMKVYSVKDLKFHIPIIKPTPNIS
jgi:hypothetical protein